MLKFNYYLQACHNDSLKAKIKILIGFLSICLIFASIECDDNPKQQPDLDESKQSDQKDYVDQIKRDLREIVMVKVDTDKDGQVSFEELKNYLGKLHEKNIDQNVDKQWVMYSPQIHEVFSWEGYEPDKMEVLTWDHYFNQTYPELEGIDIGIPIVREQETVRLLNNPDEQPDDNKAKDKQSDDQNLDPQFKQLKQMALRADTRWKLADENGDTLLTKSEFKYLLHPDEGHEELQKLFVREATEDMDSDKDGKINLEEFMKHLQILASDQEKTDENWLFSQKENFGRFLDKNKDGSLDEKEIKDWLVPSKSDKFKAEATRLLNIGDQDDDSRLSMAEIGQNYEHFLTLFPSEYWQSSDDTSGSNSADDEFSDSNVKDEL